MAVDVRYTPVTVEIAGPGTVSAVAGSKTITGVGTSWPGEAAHGCGILVDTDGDDVYETAYTAERIVSGTEITTEETISASFSDKPYKIVHVYYSASHGRASREQRFEDQDTCVVCSRVYYVSDLEYYEGAAYCIPRGHSRDIVELRQRNRTRRSEPEGAKVWLM